MTKNRHKAIRARISGRVQGVGFRYATIIQAKKLSLTGYVRNMPDGSVEVLAEGEPDKLEILLKWLKKGPPLSNVLTMNYSQIPFSGSYGTFRIDY